MKSPFREIIKELVMWQLRCDADHNTLWHQGFISGINEALETVRRHNPKNPVKRHAAKHSKKKK